MIELLKKSYPIFVIGIIFLFTSCGFHKLTYVDDIESNKDYLITPAPELKIQPNDRLNIVISSKNAELAAPFNAGTGSYSVSSTGDISSASTATVQEKGYLVNPSGEIDFPILGKIHVQGLTQIELNELIKKKLTASGLIKDPMVSTSLLNLKIMMLGEIGSVGILSTQDNQITLLEAIAKSGGVTNNARIEKVEVIRETGGVRKMYTVNLRSVSLFDSPVYYLQQNDIVNIRPISPKPTQASENTWKVISSIMSVPTIILSLLILTKK